MGSCAVMGSARDDDLTRRIHTGLRVTTVVPTFDRVVPSIRGSQIPKLSTNADDLILKVLFMVAEAMDDLDRCVLHLATSTCTIALVTSMVPLTMSG